MGIGTTIGGILVFGHFADEILIGLGAVVLVGISLGISYKVGYKTAKEELAKLEAQDDNR